MLMSMLETKGEGDDRAAVAVCGIIPEFFSFSLSLSLSPSLPLSSGLVPLHNACSFGHYEVVELLLKVSKEERKTFTAITLFHVCLCCEVVLFILSSHSFLHLHSSLPSSAPLSLNFFHQHNANVNVTDLWKFTPLHEAAAKGKYEICKLLLKVCNGEWISKCKP